MTISTGENVDYYREQLQAKEYMLEMTTRFLQEARADLETKHRSLEETTHELMESIDFARLIQTSLLPPTELLKVYFKDAAFNVKQKVGIGGDFLFTKNTGKGIVFGLLDCTGHGIPAAMLSVSAQLMLNEFASTMDIDAPDELLRLMNRQLLRTFSAQNHFAQLEGTLCFYPHTGEKMLFSSARGKALLLNADGTITHLPRSRQPIGENPDTVFESITHHCCKGDRLILYSDGLTDQFGGPAQRKFSQQRLNAVLQQNNNATAVDLACILDREISSWKGTETQTDDISYLIIEH